MNKFYILFIFLTLLSFSCGKDNVKPSEDYLLSTDAFNSVEVIKEAYEGKNRMTLQNNIEKNLAESVIRNLFFEKAELTFKPRLVKISESTVTINLNWHGSWWTVNEKKLENLGVANLVLNKESLKLTKIDGDNPFLTPIER